MRIFKQLLVLLMKKTNGASRQNSSFTFVKQSELQIFQATSEA